MIRTFGIGLALLASGAADGMEDAIPFTMTGLVLDVRPDYATGRLDGTATLTLRNVSRTPATEVPLLVGRLLSLTLVRTPDGEVRPVQEVVRFTDDSIRQVTAAVVRLGHPVAPGDSVTITLGYGGYLVGYTETGSMYIRDRVDSAFTIIREDALAFPVLGRPALAAMRRVPRSPFRFDATITVPEGQVVAMGGDPVSRVSRNGLVSWRWRSREPVPFLNIVVAPYRRLERGGVRIYHFAEDSAGARMVDGAIAGAVDRLTAWYGPLGDGPRLTVMEIPEGWGSQASLTAGIIQTADAFRSRAELRQLYHELTHLWNVSDLDAPSPRWNEGLASFLQWRLAVELDGWDDWAGQLERARAGLLRRCEAEPRCATVAPADWGREGLTDLSYRAGLIFFRLLFDVIGAEGFDRAYRGYLETHRAGGTTADLARAFERADPRVQAVFNDWIRTPRWLFRLRAGESIATMASYYRSRAPSS